MSCILHPHWEFIEDLLPLETAIWWRDNVGLFLSCITSPKYHRPAWNSNLSNNLLIYPPNCNIKENEMNGRKSKRNGVGLDVRSNQPAPFRWINVTLTSEDLSILERETVGIEQLAAAFIQLGMLGFGLSVKYDNLRKSYAVSIYRPNTGDDRQPCGISGQSSDLRDALLVALYRFNTCLGGDFDNAPDQSDVLQPSRFR